MRLVWKLCGAVSILAVCSGCESRYATNLLGSTGVAVVSDVLSEFFNRLFQQI